MRVPFMALDLFKCVSFLPSRCVDGTQSDCRWPIAVLFKYVSDRHNLQRCSGEFGLQKHPA
jgi:hypothetical protein